MVSVKATVIAESTEAGGSLPMGSEKVQMMAETADSEIQPKISEKVQTMAEQQRLRVNPRCML